MPLHRKAQPSARTWLHSYGCEANVHGTIEPPSRKPNFSFSRTASGFLPGRTALPAHDSDMLNSLARLDEDLADISNPLRDCIRGHNDLSIEEALNLDSSHINSLDTMGFAPLHLAVMRKDIQKTKALLRHHALVDIRTGPYSQTGENSQTSLHIAAASGCSTLASVLLLHGAHINERASNYGLTRYITPLIERGIRPR